MIGIDRRAPLLAGISIGLAASPHLEPGTGVMVAVAAAAAVGLVIPGSGPWLPRLGILAVSLVIGLLIGGERLDSIRSQAMAAGEEREIRISGFLREGPRTTSDGWRAIVEGSAGRVLVTGRGPRPLGPGPGDDLQPDPRPVARKQERELLEYALRGYAVQARRCLRRGPQR